MEWKANTEKYAVYVGPSHVYFEHVTLGEDDAICCMLEGRRVYDYDMAFDMCDEVREWLEANGYNTEDIL